MPETGRRVRLPDGRRLGYAEFGDPAGRPILYFHGFPSSRLEAGLAHGAALRTGVRIVAPDRPGSGLSDFLPGRTLKDWPAGRERSGRYPWPRKVRDIGSIGRRALCGGLRLPYATAADGCGNRGGAGPPGESGGGKEDAAGGPLQFLPGPQGAETDGTSLSGTSGAVFPLSAGDSPGLALGSGLPPGTGRCSDALT